MNNTKRSRKEKLLSYLILTIIAVLLVSFVGAQESTMDIVTHGGATPSGISSNSNINFDKYSVSYDFVAGAYTNNLEMCSCSNRIDKIFITNTGSFGAVFTLDTNLPDFVTLPVSTITIEPGQSVVLDLLISAPCGEESQEDYSINIKSNLGQEKVISRPLSFQKCQSINAVLFADKDEVLPCEPINYKIEIDNPSNFAETYYIEPQNYAEFFDSPLYELDLPKGKKGVVDTTLTLSCADYGEKQVGFNIYSAKNELFSEVSHSFNVLQAYEFSTDLAESYNSCEGQWNELPITINNDATVSNGFNIELVNSPSFVSLDNTHLDIESNESKMFGLLVNPEVGDKGNYNFKIKISSDIGDNILEKNINLTVNDCYKLSVTISGDENPNICSGKADFTALIKNEGSFTEDVSLFPYYDLEGIGNTSKKSITLDSGEEKEINLSLDIPNDFEGTFSVYLSAVLDNMPEKLWKDSIKITAHNQYSCTKSIILKDKIYARYTDSQAIIKIKNNGYTDSKYSLFLDGKDKLKLTEDVISLMPGEVKYLAMDIDPDVQTQDNFYYLKMISDENGEVYEFSFELVLTDTPILEKIYAYSTTSTCKTIGTILVIILILSMILFVVRALMSKSTYKGQGKFNIVLLILIILIAIATFVVFGTPDNYAPPLQTNEKNYGIVWYEDTIKTLDMSDYFIDPDGDLLSYKVEDEPDEIKFDFKDNILTLTPKPDWFGNRRIRFVATDSDGFSIKSPRITLEVVDYPEFDLANIHSIYCAYINAALLILILLFFMLTPLRTKPKMRNGKVAKLNIEKEKGYFYFVDSDGDVSRKKVKRNGKK